MPARLSLTLAACASVLALSACKDNEPPAPAAAYDLANAPPAVINTDAPASYAGYAPAERAYAFDRVTYRATPSYGFRYGDEEPWAWRTADDYSMYAEPYDDGYRNYYYAPGADYPYFVRDDDYGYGYGPDGALIAVYDSAGALLPQDRLYALASLAGAYLVRASAIRRYGLDDRYRVAVTEDYWSARAPRYYEIQQVWYTVPDRQPQWRAWRTSHQAQVAPLLPRGEVRRWSKDDGKAWKAYEKADRKAWQAEDKAWRKEGGRDRGGERQADGRPDHVRQAAIEAPRRTENGRRGPPDRLEMATADPRSVHAVRGDTRAPQGEAAQRERHNPREGRTAREGRRDTQTATATADPRPAQAERAHGGGRREARVASAQPPQPSPRRQHGGRPEARQEAAAAPRPPQQHAQGGGHAGRGPDRAAAAPQVGAGHDQSGQGHGGGKPGGKGRDKGKE